MISISLLKRTLFQIIKCYSICLEYWSQFKFKISKYILISIFLTKKMKDVSSSFTFENQKQALNRTLSLTFIGNLALHLIFRAPKKPVWEALTYTIRSVLFSPLCECLKIIELFSSVMIERLFENIHCLKVFIDARNYLIERNL